MDNSTSAFNASEDFEFLALKHALNYRQALFHEFQPWLRGNVVECGAGVGQMTELLLANKEIKRLACVEPDSSFCTQLQGKFPGLELYPGTIASLPGGGAWDALVSINVLEHIEEDGRELHRYHERLRPTGGVLCLLVPARPEIYGAIDRKFGHFRRYTKGQLATRLYEAGYTMEKLEYFNLVGYFAWWANFRLFRRQRFDPSQVRLFDSLIFPVMHWWERTVMRPPLGQSLLVIARAQ